MEGAVDAYVPPVNMAGVKGWGLWCLWGVVFLGCSTSMPPEENATVQPQDQGDPYALVTTSRGAFLIQLLFEIAPGTVENFVRLSQSGFYVRTTFHRVFPGEMIQGGDPNSKDRDPYNDGQGNSGTFLPAEFTPHPFVRGTVAMAREPDNPDSASSQFFVVLRRVPDWDGKYTVFGSVVEGIQVVEDISRIPRSKNPRLENTPVISVRIQEIRIVYR